MLALDDVFLMNKALHTYLGELHVQLLNTIVRNLHTLLNKVIDFFIHSLCIFPILHNKISQTIQRYLQTNRKESTLSLVRNRSDGHSEYRQDNM